MLKKNRLVKLNLNKYKGFQPFPAIISTQWGIGSEADFFIPYIERMSLPTYAPIFTVLYTGHDIWTFFYNLKDNMMKACSYLSSLCINLLQILVYNQKQKGRRAKKGLFLVDVPKEPNANHDERKVRWRLKVLYTITFYFFKEIINIFFFINQSFYSFMVSGQPRRPSSPSSKSGAPIDYSRYVQRFGSAAECSSSYCKDLNYR